MNNIALTRRRFLAGTGLAAGAILAAATLPAWAKGRHLNSFGIQLYTVREQMKKDVAATLEAIASFGYKEVEFAGYFGHSPAKIKSMLQDAGLTAPSAHIGLSNFDKNLTKTLDDALEAGHKFVTVPAMPKILRNVEGYKKTADKFNVFGEEANKRGLRFGYHNHNFEFEVMDGITPYDLLLDRVDAKNMQFTLDLYWVTKAGHSPLAYIDKYPGRFEQCHVKDMDSKGNMVDVGDGIIDFPSIFAASKMAGFKHYYVEKDRTENSLLTAQRSAVYLKKLTF